MNKFKQFVVSFAVTVLLVGCGGGGGGGGSSSGTPSSGTDTDDNFKEVTEYEVPVVDTTSSQDVLVGLANGTFMVAFNKNANDTQGLEDAKAEKLLEKVLSLMSNGTIEGIVTPGNVRNDIAMDRLVFDFEDENGVGYLMPEYVGMIIDFEYEGETISAEVQTVDVTLQKFKSINFFTGYDNLDPGGVDFNIHLLVGDVNIIIANTNIKADPDERMNFDTGLLSRAYSDYAELDESMFSVAFWSRIPEELQDAILKEDSFLQSFHDMHCSYVGDGLLGVTRLNASDFYGIDYDDGDEDTQTLLLTQAVAYKSDVTLVGANGTEFELTEIRVRAVTNVSDEIYDDGTPKESFDQAQKDIEEYGYYSYHLNFKYEDIYADVQCKRKQ